jgi:hypothetical protein
MNIPGSKAALPTRPLHQRNVVLAIYMDVARGAQSGQQRSTRGAVPTRVGISGARSAALVNGAPR